jgi:hypothetical protein
VGKTVAKLSPALFITIGPHARPAASAALKNGYSTSRNRSFRNQPEALSFIRRSVPPHSIIYFKVPENRFGLANQSIAQKRTTVANKPKGQATRRNSPPKHKPFPFITPPIAFPGGGSQETARS